MDPHKPTNPKGDHSQLPKRTWAPVEPLSPLSPRSEQLLDDFIQREHERNYARPRDSDDDSDEDPWLYPQIVTPVQRPAKSYPQQPPVWATYESGQQQRPSSSQQNPVEAEKNTLPVEQEMRYFDMLTELTKIDTSTMSEVQKRAHDAQIDLLCTKLGIAKR